MRGSGDVQDGGPISRKAEDSRLWSGGTDDSQERFGRKEEGQMTKHAKVDVTVKIVRKTLSTVT